VRKLEDVHVSYENVMVPRIRMLWASMPAQLAKENRKFVYGIIRREHYV